MNKDVRSSQAVGISSAIRKELKAERKRTATTALALLRDAEDLPDGLTGSLVNRWIGGIAKSAPQRQIDYVLARWRALPDGAGLRPRPKQIPAKPEGRRSDWPDHRPILDEDRAALEAHRERTKIGASTLLKGATDLPPGLTPNVVSSWLTGRAKTADPTHFAYVLARWDAHGR
jgi:hypothetical protein